MNPVKLFYFLLPFVNCNEHDIKRKPNFTQFRRRVEEIPPEETTTCEDNTSSIESFLFKNVKKIFGTQLVLLDSDPKIYESTVPVLESNTTLTINILDKIDNIAVTKSSNIIDDNAITNVVIQDLIIKNELLNLTKDLDAISKAEDKEHNVYALKFIDSTTPSTTQEQINITSKRSCIFCNNIDNEDCASPKNKLIPSTVCELDEDLCYSQHTPFGLIDRGCFNINRNVTLYVCSCNLCNYIAISEMPQIFSTKRDWTENVIEMSRTKRFRRSIFKDMTCLRCEANVTTKSKDLVDSANCLEGNIGGLPIQECEDNEICGVRAIRSEGYLWRGCVSQPLYNYWWSLCDTDLCNYDALVSIYDTF